MRGLHRTLPLLVVATLALALASCGEKDEPATTDPVTTESSGASNSNSNSQGENVNPPRPPVEECEAPRQGKPDRGTPITSVPAHAWLVQGDLVRANYPGSGSNQPCEIGVVTRNGRSRVVIRILNPPVATLDLRQWCVEGQIPAEGLAPSHGLDSVDPGVKRQLQTGDGCVRSPWVSVSASDVETPQP